MQPNLVVNTWDEEHSFKVQVPKLGITVTITDGTGEHNDGTPIINIEGPEVDPQVTDEILNKARGAFWKSIAESYPDVSRGDMPFDTTDAFDIKARGAIERWLELNALRIPAIYYNGIEQQP